MVFVGREFAHDVFGEYSQTHGAAMRTATGVYGVGDKRLAF